MAKDKDELPPDSLHGPLCESDLLEHEAAERTLLDSWSSGRLHHAWLISGPAGIGKATLACRFARFLLAQGASQGAVAEASGPGLFGDLMPAPAAPMAQPTSLYVAPDNPLFHRIAMRGHADLYTVTLGYDVKRARERKVIVVDDVRDIRNFISLTAAENGYRVVIIDGAEDMNKNAANALLKMLEEPPPRTVFLLVCHAPGRLLPTIRSRCRTLTLRPLRDDTLAALLRRHRPDLADDETAALLRIADGSIGRALRYAEEGGVALYGEMIRLLMPLPELDIGALHTFGEKLARPNGIATYNLFGELLGWWLVRMVRGAASGVAAPEIVSGEQGLMQRLTRARSLDQWAEVWEKIAHLFTRAASVNLDRKQTVLSAMQTLQISARG